MGFNQVRLPISVDKTNIKLCEKVRWIDLHRARHLHSLKYDGIYTYITCLILVKPN